jgi:hypothetical protein
MPTDECRSEGTPSPGEGPDVRGEPFFAYFFLAFEKKVSRRKGETISGRYRRNGYVHHAETGRLSGRLRKQAPQPPIPKSQAKKRATEVAQNALRAHYIQKELRLTLMRILPDKKSEPCEKQNHEADCQHPCDHHVVEKHDGSPALALLR